MAVTIARSPSTPNGTFGVLSIDGIPTCVTCELPFLNNAPDVSSIPESPLDPATGLPIPYHCVRHISAKFPLGNTWEITNVPGRTGILIHNANDIAQLEGCVAVGSTFGEVGGLPAVLNSVATLTMLNQKLGEEYDLTILQAS
jgi:hypothetical protein